MGFDTLGTGVKGSQKEVRVGLGDRAMAEPVWLFRLLFFDMGSCCLGWS